MVKKCGLGLLLAGLLTTGVFAQSVEIKAKLETYTRPQPESEFKGTFTVSRPLVKAATADLSAKIQKAISYESVMGLNVAEEQTEIQWLEEAYYQVGYNKNGILSMELTMAGTAAYPDAFSKNVVVNLKTGAVVGPADVFINLPGLAALVKKDLQAEIKDSIAAEAEVAEFVAEADFTVENLAGFSVTDTGVLFHYDYGFPHVILALEPAGVFTLSWKTLKPYIKPAGLFAQFAK